MDNYSHNKMDNYNHNKMDNYNHNKMENYNHNKMEKTSGACSSNSGATVGGYLPNQERAACASRTSTSRETRLEARHSAAGTGSPSSKRTPSLERALCLHHHYPHRHRHRPSNKIKASRGKRNGALFSKKGQNVPKQTLPFPSTTVRALVCDYVSMCVCVCDVVICLRIVLFPQSQKQVAEMC